MTITRPQTVLISGAGIAGPTLAFWLHRHGFAPTVVELAPGIRPGGQTVDLRGAGRTVVERMGLMPEARRRCMDQRGIAYVDGGGRHVAEMTVEAFGGDGIVSELEILRGDLCSMLYDATADDVEYLFGLRVTELREGADGVAVTFSDGGTRTFDLVVGADGPHSGIRRLAFGPEERFVTPVGGYTAWFTAPDHVGLDGWYAMYNEPGGLVASMRPDSTPGRAKAGLSFTSAPLEYDRRDIEAQRRMIAERFAGVGWEAPALVAAAGTAEDFYLDAILQIHMPSWSTGRVALVGDAGYCPCPLTGMGTSLGLVGAYVLAGELAAARGDHTRAFAAYEGRMRPYVAQGQELPPGGIKGYAPASAFAIRMRAFSTRLMVSRPLRGLVRKAFFGKADAIDLPDYPVLAPEPVQGT
ncbi:MAG: FAD-dependent monooxygenase [Pseudonocardia sp.]|nr:FAD-dependent monooxygenase [Pseudonocardia sp.]